MELFMIRVAQSVINPTVDKSEAREIAENIVSFALANWDFIADAYDIEDSFELIETYTRDVIRRKGL